MKIGKGKILIGLLAAAVLVFGGLAALGLPVAVGAEKKVPIYCVDTPEKKIAISFDAAWGDDHTKPILVHPSHLSHSSLCA